MSTKIIILSLYFIISLTIGFIVKKKAHVEDYYLADRKLSPFIFAGTMIATNLSAFTIFGTSGIGYREGLAFFPIMGFGTGFMAITFCVIGIKIWKLGKTYGLVTPAELIHKIYNNKTLSIIFSLVLIAFTLPYVAIQPYAAGKVVSQLFGVPTWVGATVITLIIVCYTLRGGLRAIAVTDIFQGLLMLILLIVAIYIVGMHYGGTTEALKLIENTRPALLSREGTSGFYTPGICFSYILLWFFCDPMFPQIFQRFYAAESPRAIKICSITYPLVCSIIFIIPITIGVLGNITFPGLAHSQSDAIMAILMTHIGGDIFGTLVLTAGIAALMSTMDSQLLTLSSIFTRDLLPLIKKGSIRDSTKTSKLMVVLLALCGLIIALATSTTILNLGMTAFTGLSVLFPTVLFGLYLDNKARAISAIMSIITGEIFVLLYHYKILSNGGFLGVVPIMLASAAAYLITQTFIQGISFPSKTIIKRILQVSVLLSLAIIPVSVSISKTIHYIFPDWVWYFIALSALQSIFCAGIIFKQQKSEECTT